MPRACLQTGEKGRSRSLVQGPGAGGLRSASHVPLIYEQKAAPVPCALPSESQSLRMGVVSRVY